jgi:hypothetical protein
MSEVIAEGWSYEELLERVSAAMEEVYETTE